MSTFKFILRTDYKTQTGYSKIYIRYTHQSKWFDIPTGQSCREEEWNKEKGEPRRNHPYREELLNELNKIKERVIKSKDSLIRDDEDVSVDNLRRLVKNNNKDNQNKLSFTDGWKKHLESRKNQLKKSTITVYNVTLNHLIQFCSEHNKTLNWSLFDLDFECDWNNYFFDNDISNGTSGKYFKTLKTFLHWGYDRKYFTNDVFKKYKIEHSEPEIYPLKEKEVLKIRDFLRTSTSYKHKKVGLMFLFMCYTSLRFSDLQRLTFNMIHKGDNGYSNGYIRMDTKKTGRYITVPLTSGSLGILMELHFGFNIYMNGLLLNFDHIYDSSLNGSKSNLNPEMKIFENISNQKFNKYIKELCEEVELSRKVEVIRNVGNQRRSEFKNLWETIGTHTGRRTFITLSLQKGMRPETIMEITGHVKTDTMYRYNRITTDVTVSETLKSWDSLELENPSDEKFDDLKKHVSKEVSKIKVEDNVKMDSKPKEELLKKGARYRPFIPPDFS